MNLLIENALVVTQDRERRVLRGASVAIRGDRIVAVGEGSGLSAEHPDLQRLDAAGKALLPGFVNVHTHTVLLVLRGTVEDMTGDAIYGYMTPISFAMTPDERTAMARLGCLEAIRSGTTTLADPFRHVAGYAEGMAESGMRLYLSESGADALTLKIRQGIYEYDRDWGGQFLTRIEALISGFHGAADGRVQVQIAAHAPDNCSPWMLGRLNDLAQKHGLRRTVHLSQSTLEVRQVRAMADATSSEYLHANGWLGDDLVAAHWTHCTDADVDLLAGHGVHMAHCPANSSRQGPHTAPMRKILDAGVNVALGTDNMTEDMFQAMQVGSIIHRGSHGGGVTPSPQQTLDTATVNGARALGREHDLGVVAPGYKADLQLVDLSRPNLRPLINVCSNLVHYGSPSVVDSLMVDGEWLMRAGRVQGMDETEVVDTAQAATVAAWRRLAARSPDIVVPEGLL